MTAEQFNYKASLAELEKIVGEIETGEPDVDDLIEMVNRATVLVKKCKSKLKGTEDSLNESLEGLD